MEEYLGRQLERYEVVHHINGDPRDNRIENLEIFLLSEHSRCHMPKGRKLSKETREKLSLATFLTGKKGEDNNLSVLTEVEVVDIKKRLQIGEGVCAIAKNFEVHFSAISKIKRGVTWSHVQV